MQGLVLMSEQSYILHNRPHTHELMKGKRGCFECNGPLRFEFSDEHVSRLKEQFRDKHFSCLSTGKMVVITEKIDKEV